MKLSNRIPFFLIVGLAFLVWGCPDKNKVEPDPEAEKLELLSFSWNFGTVTLDGEDRTADFSGATLTITNTKQYSTSAGIDPIYNAVWPSSGTWDFKDIGGDIPDLNTIIRDGTIEVSIDLLTETSMILSFDYVTGSIEGITGTEGHYICEFSR